MNMTTSKTFKNRAERVLRKGHPDANITIKWQRCVKVTWADGSSGYSGTIEVSAPGYRTRAMFATLTGGAVMVR